MANIKFKVGYYYRRKKSYSHIDIIQIVKMWPNFIQFKILSIKESRTRRVGDILTWNRRVGDILTWWFCCPSEYFENVCILEVRKL